MPQPLIRAFAFLLCAFGIGPLSAATTYERSTRGWAGTGTTNDWSFSNLNDTPYSKTSAAMFKRSAASVTSPAFDGRIVSVEIDAYSSRGDPERLLQVRLFSGEKAVGGIRTLAPTPTDRSYGYQTLRVDRGLGVDRLHIGLSDGDTGNWGLLSVRVTVAGEDEVSTPYGLAHAPISQGFIASWTNESDICSNEVRVVTTNAVPFEADYAAYVSFEDVAWTGGQAKDISADIATGHPGCGGWGLYADPNALYALRVGSSTKFGMLAYAPTNAYAGLSLVIKASRFGSNDGYVMPLYWILGDVTNDLATLNLTLDMQHYIVSLEDVPDGATLALRAVTNRATASKTNARTLLGTVGLATAVRPAHVASNEVSRFVVAHSPVKVVGLKPRAEYLWSVCGFNTRGCASPFATYERAATDRFRGFRFTLQ